MNGISGDPIKFDSVTLCEENAKVHVRVLRWVRTKLISLTRKIRAWRSLKLFTSTIGFTMDDVRPAIEA